MKAVEEMIAKYQAELVAGETAAVMTGGSEDERRDGSGSLHSTQGRVALVATVAASAMASLDATVVNVALPHIGEDLDAGVSALQWVLTGYLLALASLILLGGALGDRFGRRKVFIIGTVWFAVASLLCGAAPNIEVLVAARVLQGVGGALLTPGSLAILQASFRESDRAAAVGAWSGLGGVAGAIGPFVGGWLVDGPGWRWAFLINLPVAAIASSARAGDPETRDPHAGRRLDLVGAALAVVSLATSTWALTEAGPRGWTDPAVLAARRCRGRRHRGVRVAHAPCPRSARAARAVPEPHVHGHEPAPRVAVRRARRDVLPRRLRAPGRRRLVGAPGGRRAAAGDRADAAVLGRVGCARPADRAAPQLTVGPLLAAAGLLLLARVGPDASWVHDVLPGAVVFGLGLVTFVAPLTATVMGAADPDHVSVASGVNNAIARTASLTALAVIPVVSGLAAATNAAEVTHSVRLALVIAAAVAAAASPLAFVGL